MDPIALVAHYRAFTRDMLHNLLNVGGLALGIATAILLGLYVRHETSFETWLPDHDKVYLVQTVWSIPQSPVNGAYHSTMGGLLEQLQEDFPGLLGTRIRGGEDGGVVIVDGIAEKADVAQVDPRFLEVFPLAIVRGEGRGALGNPSAMLISESAARRFFGEDDPVGQRLTVAMDEAKAYEVAGVFRDLPANSDLRLAILVPMPRTAPEPSWFRWGSTSLQTFLRFETPQEARAFEQRLAAFVDRRGTDLGNRPSEGQQLRLLRLADWHFAPEGKASASRRLTVGALGLVGVLTLAIAVINYVNLATARAVMRAREVAMRKVLGASRAMLLRQFLGEAVMTVALAALLALVLAEIGLPLVNAAGGLSLDLPYAFVVPVLALLVLVVGVLAGFYPALLLSRYQPAQVLASTRSPGGGRAGARVRELLVIGQFGLAIAFMIVAAVLFAQTRHLREADPGYAREGLIAVLSLRDSLVEPAQRRAFVEAARALPQVTHVALGNTGVGGSGSTNAQNVPLPGVPGDGPSLNWEIVGPQFFETYGTRVLAGRLFDAGRAGDEYRDRPEGEPVNIVINAKAVATLGFSSADAAIGKTVGGDRPRTISGVIDGLRFLSPREAIPPTYYLFTREPETTDSAMASVRFRGDAAATLSDLEAAWQRTVPQFPFEAQTAEQRLQRFHDEDERAMRLFTIGAGLAVLIGCVGLWGLASFNTARRVREIGIRKTLGASTADVVRVLVGQFLRPVLLANLIAWPLAWLAMDRWLGGFADRIALSPLFFLGAGLLAALIAVGTVWSQSFRAARADPGWALRHD